MSDEIVINITPDPSINISAVDSNEEIALNPLTLNQGIISHSVTHQKNGSDELVHNLLGGLDGGQSGQYYHLTSGEYSNLVTGSVVRPNETGEFIINAQTGQFYANSNPSGFITGVDLSAYATEVYVTGISGGLQTQITTLDTATGNLNTRLTTVENDISILESATGTLLGYINSNDSDISTLQSATGNLDSRINANDSDISSLQTATGQLNNYVIDLQGVTGTFVLYSETGQFYANSNPSGFITGVDLSSYATQDYVTGISGDIQTQITNLNDQTGSYVLNTETGQFYAASNPNSYITGIDNLVYTTGDQKISGIKIFGEDNNITNSQNSNILGGYFNSINNADNSIVAGGINNNIYSGVSSSSIIGGVNNAINQLAFSSTIVGGDNHAINAPISTIVCGREVTILNNHTGATVLADGQERSHYSKGAHTCSLDFANGVYIDSDLNISGTLSTNNRPTVNGTGVLLSGEVADLPTTIVYTTGDQKISGIKIFGENNNIFNSSYSHILGGINNKIESNDSYNTIVGGSGNKIIGGSINKSFIGGGINNTIQTGSYVSIIAIGENNTIQKDAPLSIIGGGANNTIQTNSFTSVIAGGSDNTIGNNAFISVIAGGQTNSIGNGAYYSVIGGGSVNTIGKDAITSVICGGNNNIIQSGAKYASILGGTNVLISSGHTGATVLADGESRSHYSKGAHTCSLDFAGGVYIDSDLNISGTLLTNNRPLVNGTGVLLVGESSTPADVVYQTGDQTISGIKTFTTGLNIDSANHQITLGTGDGGNKIILTTPLNILGNRTYTIPDIGSSAAFVLTQGSQTINGNKTFNASMVGNGLFNLFPNEAGDSPHSLLTQQQLMLNGHKFRQLVNIFNNKTGTNANTISQTFQVLGMKTQIGNAASQAATAFTLDSIFCADTSAANIPINNEIDVFFHGVAMQFQENTNWVARINFGVPANRVVPFSDSTPTSSNKQWGVEFYSLGSSYYGRLYHYFGSLVYGDPFLLPVYAGATAAAWQGFIYSIRMRQFPIATNTLRIEFYMNESSSNNGGTALSKTNPLALLNTPTLTEPNYRLDGKHINFEVASSSINTPLGIIRMQCSNMYCQFK